jgi:sRNA-binding protein
MPPDTEIDRQTQEKDKEKQKEKEKDKEDTKSQNRRPPGQIGFILKDWAQRWPDLFKKPTPLAIGIASQIRAQLKAGPGLEIGTRDIHVVLHCWTTRRAYYEAVERGDPRRNLDGTEAGPPDDISRELARAALLAMRQDTPTEAKAFSGEAGTGSREENTFKQKTARGQKAEPSSAAVMDDSSGSGSLAKPAAIVSQDTARHPQPGPPRRKKGPLKSARPR